VLGINDDPVTIKSIELSIVEHAFDEGWITPQLPLRRTGKRVAVVGSGPAGLAAAQQLNRAGHRVTVYERDDRIGGLLRYGIPEFKMEKKFLDRRLRQLEAEGVIFRTKVNIGETLPVSHLQAEFDAVLLTGGACQARDLPIPGRELKGVHFAMEYLTLQNRRNEGDRIPDDQFISAEGKRVVIIGGGDTGADCLGTAHRQGALSVHQFELMPRPPDDRTPANPWPEWAQIFRVSGAHEEGGERVYSVSTTKCTGNADGCVTELHGVEVERTVREGRVAFTEVPGTEFAMKADLVLLAMGFTGPERGGMLEELGVRLTARGNVATDANWMTSVPGVFAAGDMQRGQSLIVWAIAEGRSAARGIDLHLMGQSELSAPVAAGTVR
jgi:glutamate synthase (NADPH/NADH) small chain